MNSLPPLVTVRRLPTPDTGNVKPAAPASVPLALPVPPVAREFLSELARLNLIDPDRLPEFITALGDRAGQLTSRDRTAEAVIGLKLATRYIVTRALAGQTHGLIFGNYRVLDRLSSGSVGVVFRAEHLLLGRPAAIKALALDDSTSATIIERFIREVRVLATVSDPHVVPIYDAGRLPPGPGGESGVLYTVSELVSGGDVEEAVYAAGPRPPALACKWARETALGLTACHVAGFIHRDVKPSNLLLTADGTIKLTDFGLARAFGSTRTAAQTLLGSLEFMAPEQLADAATARELADVYGLGATLFWVLTGQTPHPQERSAAAAAAAIRSGPPRRLRDISPDLPRELDALVNRLLAPAPGHRPTALQAAEALAKFCDSTPALPNFGPALTAQLEQSRAAVWAGLAATAATRPGETPAHQARVTEFARELARVVSDQPHWTMFTDPVMLTELEQAAAVHDVGLVGVPDEIVLAANGGGRLASSEKHLYEQHPAAGDAILTQLAEAHADALPALRMVRAVVRHHHERWDGAGFPDGLAGDAIPPAARIAAVALAYEALREYMPHSAAMASLRSQAGTAFDPAVIAALPLCESRWADVHAESLGEFAVLEPADTPSSPRPLGQ